MKCYENERKLYDELTYLRNNDCQKRAGVRPAENWCPAIFDGWNCWNHTQPGSHAIADCSKISYFESVASDSKAAKYCTPNGTWWRNEKNVEWANYTMCFEDTSTQQLAMILHIAFIVGYSISVILCAVAFVIFTFVRQLRSEKNRLHMNLFASFILNGIFQISWLRLQVAETILRNNPIWCRALHVMTIYLLISNYAWMFCEGLYLNLVVHFPFIQETKIRSLALIIGWSLPIIPCFSYLILRITCIRTVGQLAFCWTTMIPELWWCYASFSLLFQIVNLLFLINIVRVVFSKSQHPTFIECSSSHNQFKAMVKSLAILAPLFGVQYVLSCFYRPMDPNSIFTTIFQVLYVPVTSLQGAIVAILVCFLNSEVQSWLKREWNSFRDHAFLSKERRFSQIAFSKVQGKLDLGVIANPNLELDGFVSDS